MFKRALLAVTAICASTAMAMTIDLELGSVSTPASASAPAGDAACHAAAPSTEPGCALRAIDSSSDATISPAELASLAAPAPPAIEWPPLHPPRSTGLDFKDAAIEPGSVLHATLDRDSSHPLIPALLALGALVVLLRQRPL